MSRNSSVSFHRIFTSRFNVHILYKLTSRSESLPPFLLRLWPPPPLWLTWTLFILAYEFWWDAELVSFLSTCPLNRARKSSRFRHSHRKDESFDFTKELFFLFSFVVWVLEYCMAATITILRVQAAEMKHNFSLLFFFFMIANDIAHLNLKWSFRTWPTAAMPKRGKVLSLLRKKEEQQSEMFDTRKYNFLVFG